MTTLPPYIDPKTVTVEARWLPLPGHEGRLDVLDRALAAESWQVRAGVKEWLRIKAAGGKDPTSSETRSRYRKLLERFSGVDPDGGGRGSAGGSAEVERALRVLESVAGVEEVARIRQSCTLCPFGDELREAA